MRKSIIILEDFYENPYKVIDIASTFSFKEDNTSYKGYRSVEAYKPFHLKETIEDILQEKIKSNSSWDKFPNASFQITHSEHPQVYHCDSQSWAGVLYLSPNSPIMSGTRTHISLLDGSRRASETTEHTFSSGFYDSTKFATVDNIGNIFNRLVLFDSTQIHSAGPYWGDNINNGRLVQLFFFDTE